MNNDDQIQISIEGEPCITLAQAIDFAETEGVPYTEDEIALIRRMRPVETIRIGGTGPGSFTITRWL